MGKFVLFFLIFVLSSVHISESYECGIRKVNSSQEISSENGATYPGQWPWHAAIYQRRPRSTFVFVCGGTLVSAKFVLTAGLCILDGDGNLPDIQNLFIRLGVFNLNAPSLNTGQHRWVSRIHQVYRKHADGRFLVTLLELSSRVVFTDYVQPACIYQLEGIDNRMTFTWPFGTTVGWGQTWDDREAVLKSSTLRIPLLLDCFGHDRVFRGNSLFCAGSANGTDLCKKDSGNGLYVELRGVWHVAAVVSFTPQSTNNHCRTDSFVGLTILYDSMMWISSVTKLPYLIEEIIVKDGREFDPTKSYRNLLPRHCGSFLQNRITKGKTAPLFAYPWMAFLANRLKDVDKVKFICAGSLINKRYVLTARRCTSFNNLP